MNVNITISTCDPIQAADQIRKKEGVGLSDKFLKNI